MANFVKSVEYVEIVLTGSAKVSANLTKGQSIADCVPFHTVNLDSSIGDINEDRFVDVEFEAGPKVSAQRVGSLGTCTVGIFVVELDTSLNVSVEVVPFTLTGKIQAVSISEVLDTDKAFFVMVYKNSSTVDDWEDAAALAFFTTTTNIQVERKASNGTVSGRLFIVNTTGDDFSVQHLDEIAMASADTTKTAPITAVDLAKTFVIKTHEVADVTPDLKRGGVIIDFQDATTVRCRRAFNAFGDSPGIPNQTAAVRVQVVSAGVSEFAVERNECDWGDSLTKTVSIKPVVQSKAILIAGGPYGVMSANDGANIEANYAILSFSSNTEMVGTRGTNGPVDGTTIFEVVKFALSPEIGIEGGPGAGPQLFNILPRRFIGPPKWPFRLNQKSPYAADLKLWLPMEPIGGTVRDLSRGLDRPLGILVNNAKWEMDDRGRHAIRLDGVDDYVNFDNILSDVSGKTMTLSIRMKIIGDDSSGIVPFGTNTGGNAFWQLQDSSSQVAILSNFMPTAGLPTTIDSLFHTHTFTSDGTDGAYYLDQDETIGPEAMTLASMASGAKNFRMGAWIGGGLFDLEGSIESLMLWDRTLGHAEIQELHHNPDALVEEYGQRTYSFPSAFHPTFPAPETAPGPQAGPQLFNILTRKPPGPPRWPFRMRRGHPQARGLVGWWPLVPAHGKAAINFAAPGAATGVLDDTLLYQKNLQGTDAVLFPGTTDENIEIAEVDTESLNLSAEMSVCAWCNPNATANSALFDKTHSGVTNNQYQLFQESATWRSRIVIGNSLKTLGGGSVVIGEDQHVCNTYDGATHRLLKDGLQQASGAETGALDTAAGVAFIGHLGSNLQPFDGQIWDVRVYDRGLKNSEVFTLQLPDHRYDLYEEYGQRTYSFPMHFQPEVQGPAAGPQMFNILPRKLPGPPKWPFRMNEKSPQAVGLVGWWPMNFVGGNTAFDLGPHKMHAVKDIDATYAKTRFGEEAGKPGSGSGDVWVVPTALTTPLDILQNVSFMCRSTLFTDSTAYLVQKQQDDTGNNSGFILFTTARRVRCEVWLAAGQNSPFGPSNGIQLGEEYLHSATWDGTTALVYQDGLQVGTSDTHSGDLLNGTGDFVIGARSNQAQPWPGLVRDVRVYDRLISAAEMHEMFLDRDDLVEEYGQRTFIFPSAWLADAELPTAPSGTGVQSLSGLSQAGVGRAEAEGTGVQVLPPTVQEGTGAEEFIATGVQVLPATVQTGVGRAEAEGAGVQVLPATAQAGAGAQVFIGTGVQTLAAILQAGVGRAEAEGTGVQTLAAVVQVGTGTSQITITATGVQALAAILQAGAGAHEAEGTGVQTLPATTQVGVGEKLFLGTGAQEIPKLVQAGVGAQVLSGAGLQLLASLIQSAVGLLHPDGAGVQILPSTIQLGAGIFGGETIGSAVMVLPSLTGVSTSVTISFILEFIDVKSIAADIKILQSGDVTIGSAASIGV